MSYVLALACGVSIVLFLVGLHINTPQVPPKPVIAGGCSTCTKTPNGTRCYPC